MKTLKEFQDSKELMTVAEYTLMFAPVDAEDFNTPIKIIAYGETGAHIIVQPEQYYLYIGCEEWWASKNLPGGLEALENILYEWVKAEQIAEEKI